MKNKSISHNEKTANSSETLLWLVFTILSTLLFPSLLGIGINQKILLLKYLLAVVVIIGFDLFVCFLSNYLGKLLIVGSKDQTKKEFLFKSAIIITSGVALIFTFVLLKATSNNTNAYLLILPLLPFEIYKNTKKLRQSKVFYLKLTKIILLLIYPLMFFGMKLSMPLLIALLAWVALFSGKYLSELNYGNLDKKVKIFKITVFSLLSSPLLFGLLVVMESLPKIFTIVNLSAFFIVYILNMDDIINKPSFFKKQVDYFVYIQVLLLVFTSIFAY